MKLLLACFSLCTVGALFAAAQTHERRGPTQARKAGVNTAGVGATKTPAEFRLTAAGREEDLIERILEKSVEAEGGALSLMGIRTRILRGRVDYSKSEVPGKFETYTKAPNKSLHLIEVPNMGQFISSSDGQNGWYSSPYMSGALEDDDRAAQTSGGNDGASLSLKYRDKFSSIKYKGEAKVGERDVHLLEGTPKGSVPMLFYFDKRGGLLLRLDILRPRSKTDTLKTVYFDRYARVDGVQIPIKMRNVHKDFTFTFSVYEVKHNVKIADGMFESPKRDAPTK